MVKSNKGLQRFTESEVKINHLLTLETLTIEDVKDFSEAELNLLGQRITEIFNQLKGVERDRFYRKIEAAITKDTKNQIWENNHNQITWAIATLMQEYGRMPSQTEIAIKTELSRQTINKHLKEYATAPQYVEQIEQFRFMTAKVLAKVFYYAVNGDMRAAKLYFSVIGNNNGQAPQNTLIKNQNNYIQINGTMLSQETVKHLNPEQLNSIETILKTALPSHP